MTKLLLPAVFSVVAVLRADGGEDAMGRFEGFCKTQVPRNGAESFSLFAVTTKPISDGQLPRKE